MFYFYFLSQIINLFTPEVFDSIETLLREWNFLKNQEEIDFFNQIRRMPAMLKYHHFGKDYIRINEELLRIQDHQKIIERLAQLEDYKMRILIADDIAKSKYSGLKNVIDDIKKKTLQDSPDYIT